MPRCYTTDHAVPWQTCHVHPTTPLTTYHGLSIERLHPFGGPTSGGTIVTLSGRNFMKLTSVGSIVVNFGNGTVDATPLGGPARSTLPGRRAGILPWHVVGTLVNATHLVCVSPPHGEAVNASFSPVAVDVSLNGQLAKTELSVSGLQFTYYGDYVLSVLSLYPVAGPKRGGGPVTIYGTGFAPLGFPSARYGGQSIKCLFGGMPPVEAVLVHPMSSLEARALLGDDPRLSGGGVPLAAVITCRAPKFQEGAAVGGAGLSPLSEDGLISPRQECLMDDDSCNELDGSHSVCVEVTLNNDAAQRSSNCVPYTYVDL